MDRFVNNLIIEIKYLQEHYFIYEHRYIFYTSNHWKRNPHEKLFFLNVDTAEIMFKPVHNFGAC